MSAVDIMIVPNVIDFEVFPTLLPDTIHIGEMIVKEIDFNILGGNLKFFFSGSWSYSGLRDRADFLRMIDDMASGKSNLRVNKAKMIQPFGSSLSISNKYNRYIVYVLSNKNWQFARAGAPFTIEKRIAQRNFYYEASVVNQKGDPAPGNDPKNPIDGCKIAYFVALGEDAVKEVGNDAYPHGLNIHVDLIDEETGTFIPLLIDPDIRYPGGNTLTDPE